MVTIGALLARRGDWRVFTHIFSIPVNYRSDMLARLQAHHGGVAYADVHTVGLALLPGIPFLIFGGRGFGAVVALG